MFAKPAGTRILRIRHLQAGNKLRINAQLINIADGFHLWATNYDREMSDILALRSEIAQQVVAALRVQLLPGEKQQLAK